LITGAGGALGRAIALRFAAEGGVVVVNDLHREPAEETVELCRAAGGQAVAVDADVSDSAQVKEMFSWLASEVGGLDVLVNNAGIGAGKTRLSYEGVGVANMPDDEWRLMLATHLDGNFFCTREAVPLMAEAGSGSIVCVSSIAAINGFGGVHYAAAKGGILGMVRSLARTLGPAGIRINALCPGVMSVGIIRDAPVERQQQIADATPLGRLGEADELAYAALYLASSESSYTTGQWMSPNGGFVIA
jgi:3-oxoacyl-[acyl-carrier protein] reductase